MPGGLYASPVLVERTEATVTVAAVGQPFVAPCDLEVLGLVARLGTAPGTGGGCVINVSNSPTSQLANVAAYNLWTATNAPSILGTATTSFSLPTFPTVVENIPYALNYPLPGPSGTVGYKTAQSTSQTTETPVTSPPTVSIFQISALVAPDNTYTDYNAITNVPANIVHAGDVLTFNVTAGGTNLSLGASATLSITLYANKR